MVRSASPEVGRTKRDTCRDKWGINGSILEQSEMYTLVSRARGTTKIYLFFF
jgi:hypothetical protein